MEDETSSRITSRGIRGLKRSAPSKARRGSIAGNATGTRAARTRTPATKRDSDRQRNATPTRRPLAAAFVPAEDKDRSSYPRGSRRVRIVGGDEPPPHVLELSARLLEALEDDDLDVAARSAGALDRKLRQHERRHRERRYRCPVCDLPSTGPGSCDGTWRSFTRSISHERPVADHRRVVRPRERVQWLWPGRVPLGSLMILAGDPGATPTSARR